MYSDSVLFPFLFSHTYYSSLSLMLRMHKLHSPIFFMDSKGKIVTDAHITMYSVLFPSLFSHTYRVEINDWPKLWPYIWYNLCSRHHFSVTKDFLDMIHLCFNPKMVIYLIMADLEELFIKAQISEIIIHYGKLGSATTVWKWFRNHYPNISTAGSHQSGHSRGSFKGSQTQ